MKIITRKIKLSHMTCTSCETAVERALMDIPGVLNAKSSHAENLCDITFDEDMCSMDEIRDVLSDTGYMPSGNGSVKGYVVMVMAGILIFAASMYGAFDPLQINSSASYAMLFTAGILSSFHCIGMCGGIALSQSGRGSFPRLGIHGSSMLYNLGRVVSYTALGALAGLIGSALSLTPGMKGALQLGAAFAMVLMGLKISGLRLPSWLSFNLPTIGKLNGAGSPFIVGLLNGLMPCGALQTMQIFALGTGSPALGALSMLAFSLGTVPLMLGFGIISGSLTRKSSRHLAQASGILVLLFGLSLGGRGLVSMGIDMSPGSIIAGFFQSEKDDTSAKAIVQGGKQTVEIRVTATGFEPQIVYAMEGIPLEINFRAVEMTQCNSALSIPAYKKEFRLSEGDNIISITPGEDDILFSCWMSMMKGKIMVVDDLKSIDLSEEKAIRKGFATASRPESHVGFATDKGSYQELKVIAEGDEIVPLILVAEPKKELKLEIGLSDFIYKDKEIEVVFAQTNSEASHLKTIGSLASGSIVLEKTGTYVILADHELVGLIYVPVDMASESAESVWQRYMGK
ncbi:sulfite exporter TauE/SafE family protein [Youngiibacter multivorans]|uniref:Sulfite exporter TauE/SafE/copper chaperone CopZ n=1 Tax=Youngiibacter multivorans TaxID=937251 RepID=A0ABS4G1G3_9CLOT|nr:sulfite exporter TauE/SafE family protein [Youngiibacter multivorans]MBP1918385.1 sulfite exporter TauE/SafE/copper chaperone CopZ [Youngiibacter multivorans]